MNSRDLAKESKEKYSLRGRVFHQIRDDILSGKYKDREELKEVAIGEELGVCRTPVREAFRQLELEGLIEINSRFDDWKAGMEGERRKERIPAFKISL